MRVVVLADAAVATSGPAVGSVDGIRHCGRGRTRRPRQPTCVLSRDGSAMSRNQCARLTAEVRRCVEAIGVGVTARVPRRRGPHRGWSPVARWTTHRTLTRQATSCRTSQLVDSRTDGVDYAPRGAGRGQAAAIHSLPGVGACARSDGSLHLSAGNTTPSLLCTTAIRPPVRRSRRRGFEAAPRGLDLAQDGAQLACDVRAISVPAARGSACVRHRGLRRPRGTAADHRSLSEIGLACAPTHRRGAQMGRCQRVPRRQSGRVDHGAASAHRVEAHASSCASLCGGPTRACGRAPV